MNHHPSFIPDKLEKRGRQREADRVVAESHSFEGLTPMERMDSMIEFAMFPEIQQEGGRQQRRDSVPLRSSSGVVAPAVSPMDSAMYFAAKEGDLGYLTLEPTSFLTLTPQHNTILHIAIRFLKMEFADAVLINQPSLLFQPNLKGDTPLHLAATYGDMNTIELLIRHYKETRHDQQQYQHDSESGLLLLFNDYWRAANSQGNTALHVALISRHPAVALKLLDEDERLANCVNNARESPLYLAASFGYLGVAVRLLRIHRDMISLMGPNGQTPLHAAAAKFCNSKTGRQNRDEMAKILCTKFPRMIQKIDNFGSTALHYSASTPAKRISRHLLSVDHTLAYIRDKDGLTPLLLAVLLKHWSTIDIILRLCPDCGEICNFDGQNTFHLVMREKSSHLLRLTNHPELKQLFNDKDNYGNTPLHEAAKALFYDGIQTLVKHKGINLIATNNDGLTVLDIVDTWLSISPLSLFPKITLRRHYAGRRASKIGQKAADVTASVASAVSMKELKQFANTLLVVATLLATITFAAVFQVPGGYNSDKPGSAVFVKKAAFQIFLLSDTTVVCSSMLSIFFLSMGLMVGEEKLRTAIANVLFLLVFTLHMTMITFVTAVYLVIEESKWLAILILLMGCATPLVSRFQWHLFPGINRSRISNNFWRR